MIHLEYPWLLCLVVAPVVLRRLLPAHRVPRQSLNIPFMGRLESATGSRSVA